MPEHPPRRRRGSKRHCEKMKRDKVVSGSVDLTKHTQATYLGQLWVAPMTIRMVRPNANMKTDSTVYSAHRKALAPVEMALEMNLICADWNMNKAQDNVNNWSRTYRTNTSSQNPWRSKSIPALRQCDHRRVSSRRLQYRTRICCPALGVSSCLRSSPLDQG